MDRTGMTPNFKCEIVICPAHLAFVATHCCLICGSWPVHVHHLKSGGRKIGDNAVVPLCARHHLACFKGSVHAAGNMRRWWAEHYIDEHRVAGDLFAQSVAAGRWKEKDAA